MPKTMPEEAAEEMSESASRKKIISDKTVSLIKLILVSAVLLLMFSQVFFDAIPGRTFIRDAEAVRGVAHLSDAEYNKLSSVLFQLNGEWEYYPGMLLYPEDFREDIREYTDSPKNIRYVRVPHFWHDDPHGMPGGTGFATYRMTVVKPEQMENAGIYSGFHYGAYRVFLNGKLVTGSGNISENTDEYYISYTGGAGIITEPTTAYSEIIIQVQSYDHIDAGLNDQILFGSFSAIKYYHAFLMTITGMTAGAVLILVFYFLLLFIRNTEKKEYFNFAVTSLCCFYLTLASCGENIIYHLVPAVSPHLLYKLEFITLMVGAYFASIHIIQKYIGFRHIKKVAVAYTGANCLLVVMLSSYQLSSMRAFFHSMIVLFMATALIISFINAFFVKTAKGKSENHSVMTLEFLSLLILIGGSSASLLGFTLWKGFYMLPVFVLIYCFIQVFVLAGYYNEIEKNLYKLNKTLEIRVAERTAELVEMSRKVQVANDVKTEFLTYMSHEIREPMNAIVDMSDLFDADNLNDTQRDYFKGIKKTSQTLLCLINDIMDYSKIEAGEMETVCSHFYLYSFFENICSEARLSAKAKNLNFGSKIRNDLPGVIYGDEVRIKQIIDNIIVNAVKSTDEGYVRIEVSVADEPANSGNSDNTEIMLIFTVSDTGNGISESAMPNLFNPFITSRTLNSGIGGGGTRLGLALCKRLTEMLNGKIEVESEYEKGSVFKVYLPLLKGDEKLVENPNLNEKIYAKNAKILLVEDNPINVTVGLGIFATHDITPDVAVDGYEALNMICEKDYDIVFMDQFMPGIDGLETTRRIRDMGGRYASMPVIALTANVAPGAKDMMIFKGMNDYIAKPVDRGALNNILIKWLPYEKISSALGRFEQLDLEEKSDVLAGLPLELIKIVDLNCAEAVKNMDGNVEIYINLLHQLIEETGDYVQSLAGYLISEDLKNYVIVINGVKNLLYSVGAKACADLAALLEKAASEGNREFCIGQNGAFCDNLKWLSQRIGFVLAASHESNSGKEADAATPGKRGITYNAGDFENVINKASPQKLAGIMQDLSFSFSIGDCDNIDRQVAVLREYSFDYEYEHQVAEIIKNAEVMEYDGAAEICREVINLLLEAPE